MRIWVTLVFVIFATIAATATNATNFNQKKLGPSFNCEGAKKPLAVMLCSDPQLSLTDLRFGQAYYALLQSLDRTNQNLLKKEDLEFLDEVQQQCAIPQFGPMMPSVWQQRDCVRAAYERKTALWVARLSGPAYQEAVRAPAEHVAIQKDLLILGFLKNISVPGVYDAPTRNAILAWQTAHDRPATGLLSDDDAQALASEVNASASVPSPEDAPGAERRSGEETEVALKEVGGTYLVPVQINGAITLNFTVDSGAADVLIPADVMLTLIRTGTLSQGDFIGKKTYELADGTKLPSITFLLRELRVGNHHLENVTASVGPVEGGLLLGQSFLSRFAAWTLNNQRHVLSLRELSPPTLGDAAPVPAGNLLNAKPAARFSRTACGSVVDHTTQLEWELGPDRDISWADADRWVRQLHACNQTWQMPTLPQLATLFDRSLVAGTGYFTDDRHWPAHMDPSFSGIGGGSWVWAAGSIEQGKAPAYNFNQGMPVRVSATNFSGSVRVFAVRSSQ